MIDFIFLVPIAIGMGLAGLAAFMWCLKSGQYDDLDGAAARILLEADDGPDRQPPREQQTFGQARARRDHQLKA
jgi:cbb3-type cytochrome oxidase maturation protein